MRTDTHDTLNTVQWKPVSFQDKQGKKIFLSFHVDFRQLSEKCIFKSNFLSALFLKERTVLDEGGPAIEISRY